MSEKQTPRHVLLIDDDRDITTPLATLLLVAGFEVEMAFDGPSAIESAESFHPDICLVDVNVPRLSVYDLTRCLRQLEPQPLLANITPFHERDDWDADAEFDLDFSKPSDPFVIVEQLSDFLRTGPAEMSNKLHKSDTHAKPRMPSFRR